MEKKKADKKSPKFSEGLYKSLKQWIDKQKGEFLMSDLKKAMWDRTDYGGRKFKQKLMQVFKPRKRENKTSILRILILKNCFQ